MYCLEAAIAAEPVLRRLAGTVEQARIVPLGHDLSLLLMTDEFFDAIAVAGGEVLEDFWKAPAGFGSAVVLGPLLLAEDERPSAAGSPISQALRQLGVVRKQPFDEFDTVGLGRHRDTPDWLR